MHEETRIIGLLIRTIRANILILDLHFLKHVGALVNDVFSLFQLILDLVKSVIETTFLTNHTFTSFVKTLPFVLMRVRMC